MAWNATWADTFGDSVAMDGDRFVVGADSTDIAGVASAGSAYVYRRRDVGTPDHSDDVWVLDIELVPWDWDAAGSVGLGSSVSISGDRIVGGAWHDNGACGGDAGCSSGAAYVFRYTGSAWVPEQKLIASDQAEDLRFGFSVAINGSWLAVGSVLGDDWLRATGAAYIFRLDDNGTPADPGDDVWIEHLKLTTPEGDPQDRFGQTVAISANRLVVGAPSVSFSGNGTDPGSAYVYRRDDNGTPSNFTDDSWTYEARLAASDGGPGHFFGWSLAVSDDLIIVGAPEDDDVGGRSGSAYIFRRDDNGTPMDEGDDFWFQETKLITSDQDWFDTVGYSVAISGDRVAVGAVWDGTINYNSSGSAYVFRHVGGQWIQEQKLIASDGEWIDLFGAGVAIDSGQVVVGAMREDEAADDAGAVYVYSLVDDCNVNCIPDEQDIADCPAEDLSCQDCNSNGIPDGCEDCNGNGLANSCDIDAGTSQDCTNNGVPDECEPDCNGNGMADSCDIATGVSQDCNTNRVADECETQNDCNGDGVPDECDVAAGACTDDCECDDRLGCTWDLCIDGLCIFEPSAYGDADHNDTINIFDLLCVLAGFAGDFVTCTFEDDDINPCTGNGTIDIFDLLAILNAFAGQDPCCGGLS